MKQEDTIQKALKKSYLCGNLTEEELATLVDSSFFRTADFEKGEWIFQEQDVPREIMILAAGSLIVARDTMSGRRMILSRIVDCGDTFGEVYVFKNLPSFDMYAEALEKCTILYIDKALLDGQASGNMGELRNKMMHNQLRMFADKAYMMNRRLRILSSASIREKIARLLIERQGHGNRVQVMGREEMADYLNVTRPSLSREISSMCKDGIIRSEGRTLVILDQERLESLIE